MEAGRSSEAVVFETPLGPMGALARPSTAAERGWGIARLALPAGSQSEVLALLPEVALGTARRVSEREPWAAALARELRLYLSGELRSFTVPLDLDGITGFRRRALELAARIPYGETSTYRRLAEQAGRPGAARAVGAAMASNPLPILIPCHRVLGARGSLTGYAGGLDMKLRLLQLEGATLL